MPSVRDDPVTHPPISNSTALNGVLGMTVDLSTEAEDPLASSLADQSFYSQVGGGSDAASRKRKRGFEDDFNDGDVTVAEYVPRLQTAPAVVVPTKFPP